MAKKKKEQDEIKVVKPRVVKKYLMLQDVGTNPDGSIKRPKGSQQELTKEQIINYNLNKII